MSAVGAELCRGLGEVAIARELFRTCYEELGEDPAGDDCHSLLRVAEVRCRMGDLHFTNGEAAAAEEPARTVEEELKALTRFHLGPSEHRSWAAVLNECDALLADCLFARGKRSRAAEGYRKAHQGYAVVGEESDRHNERVRTTFNAAVFAGGRWQTAK